MQGEDANLWKSISTKSRNSAPVCYQQHLKKRDGHRRIIDFNKFEATTCARKLQTLQEFARKSHELDLKITCLPRLRRAPSPFTASSYLPFVLDFISRSI